MPATKWIVLEGPATDRIAQTLFEPLSQIIYRFTIQRQNRPREKPFEIQLDVRHLVASVTIFDDTIGDWCGSHYFEGLVENCPTLSGGNPDMIATVRIFYDLGKLTGILEIIKLE